jgi:hypothetical protein
VFYSKELLITRLGRAVILFISLFWIIRGFQQFIYYTITTMDVVYFITFGTIGIIYLIPLYREYKGIKKDFFKKV